MLYMVIERSRPGAVERIGQRFKAKGRMLPENVAYVSSWMAADGSRCFQLMEAPNAEAMQPWISRWNDLVDFEIVPVMTSAEFWAQAAAR